MHGLTVGTLISVLSPVKIRFLAWLSVSLVCALTVCAAFGSHTWSARVLIAVHCPLPACRSDLDLCRKSDTAGLLKKGIKAVSRHARRNGRRRMTSVAPWNDNRDGRD